MDLVEPSDQLRNTFLGYSALGTSRHLERCLPKLQTTGVLSKLPPPVCSSVKNKLVQFVYTLFSQAEEFCDDEK